LDNALKFWDIGSGRELRSFIGHRDTLKSVAVSPDGRMALSGSDDHTLKLWDISEWTKPQEARR
jgi:WD40 repeat protein